MLKEKLKDYKIILASGSPRRRDFFDQLKLDYEQRLKPVEEDYPQNLKGVEIPIFLSELKASAFKGSLNRNEILVTSDTIVWFEGACLGKPKDEAEAFKMLEMLSGAWHEVITAISFTTSKGQQSVHCTTKVQFKNLTKEEIRYYLEEFSPFDKAGAYGIQDWIGLIGIDKIEGSYFNVMGLPTHLLYKTLMAMVS